MPLEDGFDTVSKISDDSIIEAYIKKPKVEENLSYRPST